MKRRQFRIVNWASTSQLTTVCSWGKHGFENMAIAVVTRSSTVVVAGPNAVSIQGTQAWCRKAAKFVIVPCCDGWPGKAKSAISNGIGIGEVLLAHHVTHADEVRKSSRMLLRLGSGPSTIKILYVARFRLVTSERSMPQITALIRTWAIINRKCILAKTEWKSKGQRAVSRPTVGNGMDTCPGVNACNEK